MGVEAWIMGIILLVASISLSVFNISSETTDAITGAVDAGSLLGLRMVMTIIPILVLFVATFVFKKKYILTDEKLKEISAKLSADLV